MQILEGQAQVKFIVPPIFENFVISLRCKTGANVTCIDSANPFITCNNSRSNTFSQVQWPDGAGSRG